MYIATRYSSRYHVSRETFLIRGFVLSVGSFVGCAIASVRCSVALGLIGSEDQIVHRLVRVEAGEQCVGIEAFSDRIGRKRRSGHEIIGGLRLHQIDLKLHHVLVRIRVVERERQSMSNRLRGHYPVALQAPVGFEKLAEIFPGVGDVMHSGVAVTSRPFVASVTEIDEREAMMLGVNGDRYIYL